MGGGGEGCGGEILSAKVKYIQRANVVWHDGLELQNMLPRVQNMLPDSQATGKDRREESGRPVDLALMVDPLDDFDLGLGIAEPARFCKW